MSNEQQISGEPMSTAVAMDIIYDLACQNVLDPDDCDECHQAEATRQQLALDTAHDFITNVIHR